MCTARSFRCDQRDEDIEAPDDNHGYSFLKLILGFIIAFKTLQTKIVKTILLLTRRITKLFGLRRGLFGLQRSFQLLNLYIECLDEFH